MRKFFFWILLLVISAQYQKNPNGGNPLSILIKFENGLTISVSSDGNGSCVDGPAACRQLKAWLAAGNVIAPAI